MAIATPIQRLPRELLHALLDLLQTEKLMNLDRREYLSQESFRAPERLSHDQAKDISNFRLTCRLFAETGAIHQFARIATRFSRKDLARLDELGDWPHIAENVKKFSYLVPNFYIKGKSSYCRSRVAEILPHLDPGVAILDLGRLEERAREQKQILDSEEDARVLRKALSAFKRLQHIQILRVQDREDDLLLQHLRQHDGLTHIIELAWAPACSHSTRTIGAAIMASHSPCSRFSSPMLSPQSAEFLTSPMPLKSFTTLAQQLTSLELHFDDISDLDSKMAGLSGTFKIIFAAATNMQAIHLGFPTHRPINLRLEDLFHHVTWEKLAAFGIQSWKLDADEIVQFARRHKDRLRGLRFRDVLLKEGSRWRDILHFLREDMCQLDWVSLRRVGYAKHFDEQLAVAGAEVPDDPSGAGSDSEDDEDSDDSNVMADIESAGAMDMDMESDDSSGSESFSHGHDLDQRSEADDDGPSEREWGFSEVAPGTPVSLQCSCIGRGLYPLSAEELGDDGVFVSNARRKLWERWVVRHCAVHGKSFND